MFAFINNLFLKIKARKILSYIKNIEHSLTVFDYIDAPKNKFSKYINSLSKDSSYSKIIANYNTCLNNAKEHNDKIKTLTVTYNNLLQNKSIETILSQILDTTKDEIENIYKTILTIYQYSIPRSFDNKTQYDKYKKNIEDILCDYDLIKDQKNLILDILNTIEHLPDIYIDEENANSILSNPLKDIKKLHSYKHKYYKAPVVDSSIIEKHNKQFIEKHLNDVIFDNLNGKSLDNEQRRAILCDSKSNLTIAGAGSGKTLTICGKVKFILDTGLATKDEILLLSYSKASADDLEKKINNITSGIAVETFHALGLKILTEANKKKKAIEEQLKSYIKNYFENELPKRHKIRNDLFQFISLYFYAPTVSKAYENDGDLFNDLKTSNFITLKDRLKNLSSNKEKHETIKNEFVKSNEELTIANFLFINGINYEYEKPYKFDTSTLDKRQYTPDFYLPDYDIYIEHFGIDKNGKAPQYEKDKSDKYVDSINWKRQIHKLNNTKCIETYSYEFNEGLIFDNLKSRLINNGVKFKPLTELEISNAFHNIFSGRDFNSFFNLLMTFISLYKAQYRDDSGFDKFESQIINSNFTANRTRLFLHICKDIYNYYINSLRAEDKIDFDDMILQSTLLLESSPNFKYKYIIVDEFQDISQSRTTFLQKLIEHGNSKLFAVGDDWQAIYRFAGCDVNIFLDFENIFKGAKLNFITSTHRNSSELQQIVEPFITANPDQYKKHIKSKKNQENPIRIIYHTGNKAMALTTALKDISLINPNANVLVLGRNSHDIDSFICKNIQLFNYKTIKHSDYPDMQISYSTVHSSKGLESDFVILISGENAQNGFPNKTEDDIVLTFLLGKKNAFEYAEERRLFYVALTRTKSIVYLISEKSKSSEFIKEIEDKCHIMFDESETKEDEYLCPWCKSGHLVIRTSESNKKSFYGCSNYPYCSYTNNDLKSVYFNRRCPECGDFLVLRKGSHGAFLGCHNYPRCRYTQELDE